ncbi:hypothetical protein CIG75_01865 [Tumebacillus algifaecis]|uniref:DUF4435 domain-containing protein n=1 Tax=Tumebacillus algifaecis TaxID=1214604 RepID=A0A223CX28_9BACL|nr:DUF4435 domain-containing protein [Tumebacillus algifaecis]ASS73841.1 hypothetical protein CIG75_01865 [Tumebacillus algifaecis]
MSEYPTLFVEGSDDEKTLHLMFPMILGNVQQANSKKDVRKMVSQTENSFGIVDRDFEFQTIEQPRVTILDRYALENYLLDPAYLYKLAVDLKVDQHEQWSSKEMIEQQILKMGQSFCHFATANSLLHDYGLRLYDSELRQYFRAHPDETSSTEVLQSLVDRFNKLPQEAEIRSSWAERYQEIEHACKSMGGVHQWIDGKLLLRYGIYQEIRKVYQKNLKLQDVVERLASFARHDPPDFLCTTLRGIGMVD